MSMSARLSDERSDGSDTSDSDYDSAAPVQNATEDPATVTEIEGAPDDVIGAVTVSDKRTLLAMQVPPFSYERVTGLYEASAPGQHDVSLGMSLRQPLANAVRHGSMRVVGRR